MRKFLVKLIIFALILAAVFAPVNIVIDPYNIFHYDAPRNNGVEPNKNFIKTKYILKNPDKFDSFVFGSSRAGFMDVSMLPDGKWYDMCSSEAVPAEHVRTLKILIKHGIIPRNILVMVDDISCFVDPGLHETMLFRIPYPDGGPVSMLEFYLKYCDLLATKESLDVINSYTDNDPAFGERYRTTGTERLDIESYFDPTLPQFQSGYWADYYELRLDEAISEMRELKDICDKYGIRLTVVTNPLYYLTYERDVENGYLDYLEELALVTDYYNFSSLSDITLEYTNYYETSHFTPDIGRMMINAAYFGNVDENLLKQGFGYHVDADNVTGFIGLLKEQTDEKP